MPTIARIRMANQAGHHRRHQGVAKSKDKETETRTWLWNAEKYQVCDEKHEPEHGTNTNKLAWEK